MKKILLVLAVAAMVVSSCGTKTNAQKEEVKTEVQATDEAPAAAEATAEKACCEKEATKADAACCEKDSTAVDCEKECADKAECTEKKECPEKKAEEDKA